MEQWLPKSVLCLQELHSPGFPGRRACRNHGWVRRPAAGDGVRDCFGTVAASRHLLRRCYRVPDLGVGWLARPDRRPHGRVRRGRGRHRCQARRRRPVHVHHDGRRAAVHHGSYRTGRGGEVYSPPRGAGFHQRHCGPHCQHADQGLLRAQDRECAGRFHRAHARHRRQLLHDLLGSHPAWRAVHRRDSAHRETGQAASGIHRRAGAGNDRGRAVEAAGRNDRYAIWRHSFGTAASPCSASFTGTWCTD